MAREVVGAGDRRAAFAKVLQDDATIQGLTVSPYVVARPKVTAVDRPMITIAVTPGAEGRFGWRGAIIDRFAVDVWVEEAPAIDDPPGRADQITDAILAALSAVNLRAALVGLSPTVPDVNATAKLATPWHDIEEPGPGGVIRKTADIEVEFTAA